MLLEFMLSKLLLLNKNNNQGKKVNLCYTCISLVFLHVFSALEQQTGSQEKRNSPINLKESEIPAFSGRNKTMLQCIYDERHRHRRFVSHLCDRMSFFMLSASTKL